MSVIVMVRVPGQVADFERVAKENSDTFEAMSQVGKAAGAVHHCFVEDTDGSLMIIDEWDSEESFHAFFNSQEEIPQLMAAAGVTGPPVTTSYRIIETSDRF